ncbi:phosphorylase [Methylomonas koyamae]|uniref:Phosphorylase n=1 Tax=Methylomonas koyamae TaxID=702114 RepID=A0A177NRZ7_9GAMM|nr:phosphorylase [Methylomonas koyamae]OAI20857.1 phosphorylase [Methylomonas koyamae]
MSCGIVVALPEELSTLTKRKFAPGECHAIGGGVLLSYSGAGPANAEKAAAGLIDRGANRLISWGCAAALAQDRRPGDLVVPERVLTQDRHSLATDPSWRQRLANLLADHQAVGSGTLLESGRIVGQREEKRQLFEQTGAVALDMESAAVGRTAANAQLPFLVVRAIADPAEMSLPEAVIHALDANGQVQLARLLAFLLAHPWELGGLVRLGIHFRAAQTSLKTAAQFINEITQI